MAADDMAITQLPLTLIVAATTKNGIGKNGGLPWPMLKKDMAYFARVTKRVPPPHDTGSTQPDVSATVSTPGISRNVVIMGRKTWDSIPPKLRPLKDRTNIVISTQDRSKLGPVPDSVIVASDILSGLKTLGEMIGDSKAPPTEKIFVIGGSSIYNAALGLKQTNRILMTRIHKDYECDTFFPVVLDQPDSQPSAWSQATHEQLQEFAGETIEVGPVSDTTAEGVQLEFQLYERA